MATALIDVSVYDLTNDQVDEVLIKVRDAVKAVCPDSDVDLNGDTEYDEEDEGDEEEK